MEYLAEYYQRKMFNLFKRDCKICFHNKLYLLYSRLLLAIQIFNYSSKIFPQFWLVKTALIIHHNQLLLTKLLNRWRQNDVKSAACCRLLNRWPRKPGERLCYIWWAEKQRAKWRNSFKNGEIFWMNNNTLLDLQNSSYPTKVEFNNW